MNRADVTMLMNRRRVMWDLPKFDTDTLNEWCRVLSHEPPMEMFQALDDLANEQKPPAPVRLVQHIHRDEPAKPKPEPKPLGDANCTVCDGTGFMYVDDGGENRAAPCYLCRPDDAWHKRRKNHPTEHIHSTVMAGAAERKEAWAKGEAEYVAVLRRQFPILGTLTEADIRDRMSRITPLVGYGARRQPDPPEAS